ncbi:MAG: LPXTG cell wall anchor domain-containing protein [Solobacterium sp.]|nr:LPXTG cell wall anchor domain-containing protein [Solobacterium sp.]
MNYGGIEAYHSHQSYGPGVGTWVADPNELNIYLSRTETVAKVPRTDYVIRYYHADGSVETITGALETGQSLSLPAYNKIQEGKEVYSGMTINAGHGALSDMTGHGAMKISYNSNISLVKANVYYKENIEVKSGGTVNGSPQYDAAIVNGTKKYDTSRQGLHTDKTAEPVTDSSNPALNDGRTFNLTLEAWNVGGNYANVGMVLDASGSMVWPSNLPELVRVPKNTLSTYGSITTKTIKTYSGNTTQQVSGYFLTLDQVNSILDTNYVDRSSLGYNGYRYYIKDPVANVNEHVPIGYYTGSNLNGITFAQTGGDTPTKGWYYVTSATANNYRNYGTAKQYCNFPNKNDAWQGAGSTASQFWLDDEGILHCYWYRKSSDNYYWNSEVYVSPIDADNKSEVLQYGLARFAAILNANSPTSQISMTRFSRARKKNNDYFTAEQLALLNWTTDTELITAALNQEYGNGTANRTDTQNGLDVYNYGFTGDTSTASGIDAFIHDLTRGSGGNYAVTSGSNNASKYLIIFTDGKDTDKDDPDNYWYNTSSAKNFTDALKQNGYTVFTVMMQSAGMSESDAQASGVFLRNLSGKTGEDGNTRIDGKYKYFFNFMYDDPQALVEAFETIAKEIAKPLEGYMIRDYIDPRFDLIDENGTILTRLNRDGVWMPRAIYTADGKRAMLKYDTDKKMFYVEVENQSIPTSPVSATDVTVNSTVLTVRAKADFLGGNDMLTNGNGNEENSVFKPRDGYDIQENNPIGKHSDTNTYPSKDFPKTTTDPATLDVALSNYEDTIFLGEDFKPYDILFNEVQEKRNEETDSREVYVGYLVRAGQKLHNDPLYYINILKTGEIPTGASAPLNTETITAITEGGKVMGVELQIPYYYIKDEEDNRSYAGSARHQADKVGMVTYIWKATDTGNHTLTDNNALKDYTSTTLDTVRYQLSMTYTPDAAKYDSLDRFGRVVSDSIANNGSARTLTLTNQTGQDKLIKDPVGAAAQPKTTITNPETQGLAAVHVVAGKIKLTKRFEMSEASWNSLVEKAGDAGVAFSFQLAKDGEAYGEPVTLNSKTATVTRSGDYVELSDWVTNLPQGDYTVTETAMPSGFTFVSVSDDPVVAADGDGGANGTLFAAPTEGTVTWKLGQAVGEIPSATTYASTDFTAAKVKDDNKEVDPDLTKAYLNAQIGKGIILNEPPMGIDVTLKKVDVSNLSNDNAGLLKGATFTITKYTDSNFDVIDTSSSAWSQTLEDKLVDGEYTLNGLFEFTGLSVGFYKIDEAVMPAGYISMTDDPVFEIRKNAETSQPEIVLYEKNGDSYVEVGSGATDMVRIAAGTTLYVGNTPGAALPHTGGSGTGQFALIGIILIALACMGLVLVKN